MHGKQQQAPGSLKTPHQGRYLGNSTTQRAKIAVSFQLREFVANISEILEGDQDRDSPSILPCELISSIVLTCYKNNLQSITVLMRLHAPILPIDNEFFQDILLHCDRYWLRKGLIMR